MSVAGKNAVFKVGANTIQDLNEGSITINGELIDVTNFASGGWISKMQGLKSAELSFSGFWITTDTTGQTALTTGLTAGTAVACSALFDGTAGWSGNFMVASLEIGASVADAVSVSFSLESTGALTKV